MDIVTFQCGSQRTFKVQDLCCEKTKKPGRHDSRNYESGGKNTGERSFSKARVSVKTKASAKRAVVVVSKRVHLDGNQMRKKRKKKPGVQEGSGGKMINNFKEVAEKKQCSAGKDKQSEEYNERRRGLGELKEGQTHSCILGPRECSERTSRLWASTGIRWL